MKLGFPKSRKEKGILFDNPTQTKSLTNILKNNNKIKNFEWKIKPTWVRRLLQAISYSETKRVLLFFFSLSLYKEVSLRCVIFSVWLERKWEWEGMREREREVWGLIERCGKSGDRPCDAVFCFLSSKLKHVCWQICEMSILPLVAIRICNTYVYVLTWIWTHSHQPIMPLRSHEAYIFYKTKKTKNHHRFKCF